MYPWVVYKWRISPFEWMEDKQVEKRKSAVTQCVTKQVYIGTALTSPLFLADGGKLIRKLNPRPPTSTNTSKPLCNMRKHEFMIANTFLHYTF